MDVEIVTPAGRKESLEILYNHLKSQSRDFKQWTLWLNTVNQDDINYCKKLEKNNKWIKTIDLDIPFNSNYSIHTFFKHACDPNKIYIRLDDDIVWLESNFIKKLSTFRYENPQYFLVYGNIINNAIVDHLNQRFGNLKITKKIEYNALDFNGWANPEVAEEKHKMFLKNIFNNNIEKFKFKQWILDIYERVSINCISWLGSEFAKFNGIVGIDEEYWLSQVKPSELEKPNIIYGEVVCVHYAFHTQREHLNRKTNILSEYKFISELKNRNKMLLFSDDGITNDDIINEILDLRLFVDDRGNIYGDKYKNYLNDQIGIWQHPEELAKLCLILKKFKINSFLDIGTFNGYTFKFLSEFLNKYQKTKCITIDPIYHNPIVDDRFTYLNATSKNFIGQKFDLVFIDGDHEYSSVKEDYENVGQYANICIFHDIRDEFCNDLNGGPKKFWNEIKDDTCFELFADEKPLPYTMGLGVKFNIDKINIS